MPRHLWCVRASSFGLKSSSFNFIWKILFWSSAHSVLLVQWKLAHYQCCCLTAMPTIITITIQIDIFGEPISARKIFYICDRFVEEEHWALLKKNIFFINSSVSLRRFHHAEFIWNDYGGLKWGSKNWKQPPTTKCRIMKDRHREHTTKLRKKYNFDVVDEFLYSAFSISLYKHS